MFITITEAPADREISKLVDEFEKLKRQFEVWEYKKIERSGSGYLYEGIPLAAYAIEGIIWRVTEGKFDQYKNLHQVLSDNYFMVNPTNVMRLCSNKIATDEYLRGLGLNPLPAITQPGRYSLTQLKTHWAQQSVNLSHFISDKHVLKPSVGAGGRGIVFYDETAEFITVRDGEILQPHMKSLAKELLRVQTLGDKTLGAYYRVPINEGGLANIEQGAIPMLGKINDQTTHAVSTIMETLKPRAAGIDVYETFDGFSYIIEINSAPGMNGLDMLGLPVWEQLVQYVVSNC